MRSSQIIEQVFICSMYIGYFPLKRIMVDNWKYLFTTIRNGMLTRMELHLTWTIRKLCREINIDFDLKTPLTCSLFTVPILDRVIGWDQVNHCNYIPDSKWQANPLCNENECSHVTTQKTTLDPLFKQLFYVYLYRYGFKTDGPNGERASASLNNRAANQERVAKYRVPRAAELCLMMGITKMMVSVTKTRRNI